MGRLYVQIQNSGFFFESEKPGRAELGFRRRTPLEWTAAFGWGLGSLLFTAHPVLWLGPEGLRLGESCSRILLPAWLVNRSAWVLSEHFLCTFRTCAGSSSHVGEIPLLSLESLLSGVWCWPQGP